MEPQIQFSERERQVVEQLMEGKSNKEIALALGISLRTVEFHLSRIYKKLGVTSRTEAAIQLSKAHLRETAAADLRQATVPSVNGSDHNAGTSTFMKRIQMNKSSIIGIGILVLVSVFFVGSIYSMAKGRGETYEESQNPTVEVEPSLEAVSTSAPEATSTTLPFTPTVEFVQPTNAPIPSHTVNGYTATIESAYADISDVNFLVRITGGEISFGDEHYFDRLGGTDIFDENGNLINSSGGWGPGLDPSLYELNFAPVTLLKGDRIKGQVTFDIRDAPADYNNVLAEFRFDFDLPLYPESRFYPKQTVSANGLDMLLDSVTVTPAFTQAYFCFNAPSHAPWNIGSRSTLQMNGREMPMLNFRYLFGSDLGGDMRAGSEPYWVPPTKNGRCVKAGFPIGSSLPTSLTLTIPELEDMDSDIFLTHQLDTDYPGLSPKDAYYSYLAEHDKLYKGPWGFNVELNP